MVGRRRQAGDIENAEGRMDEELAVEVEGVFRMFAKIFLEIGVDVDIAGQDKDQAGGGDIIENREGFVAVSHNFMVGPRRYLNAAAHQGDF